MFHSSHETWIGSLKRHLGIWKKQGINGEPMSEMTMFDEIVTAHYRIGGDLKTGIRFSDGKDEYNRMKANAVRIKRLLVDDEEGIGREQASQLLELLPSILAAMPTHLRTSFLNEYLSPLGLTVRGMDEGVTVAQCATTHLVSFSRESAEAQCAMAGLIDGATPTELRVADRELSEVIDVANRGRAFIRAQLDQGGK